MLSFLILSRRTPSSIISPITKDATFIRTFPKSSVRTGQHFKMIGFLDPTQDSSMEFVSSRFPGHYIGRKGEREGRGGKKRGRENKVFSKKELLSILVITPYNQTYYDKNHHILEGFQILLLQDSNQPAEQLLQYAKAQTWLFSQVPGLKDVFKS